MKILFIHQNFPGQFKNLAPALAARGETCVALTMRVKKPGVWQGVQLVPYGLARKPNTSVHPWLVDLNSKLHRAEGCLVAAEKLKAQGFEPDVIVAHPGWGESLFLRDLWPKARIGLYYELFYQSDAGDAGFDPEFSRPEERFNKQRIRLKNINNHLHYPIGDKGICPTEFQASSFPKAYRDKISIIHDGIDTNIACPKQTSFKLPTGEVLGNKDQVITFVNRNLEPYRGYHIFMRALPKVLKDNPKARILIVGGDERSYGAAAPDGKTWKDIFINEVRDQISDHDWTRVHFLGKLPYDQFLAMLQITSAHVYLTYPFVLSWSLLEAMSIGAPIVASDTDPVREVIKNGQTGHLFDFFDIKGLDAQLTHTLNDPEAAKEMGRRARDFVKTHYDLQTVCLPKQLDWIDALYESTAGAAEPFEL